MSGTSNNSSNTPNPGIIAAITAAALFGAGTPLAKGLLEHTGPWLLAALLYLGSGLGLFLYRGVRAAWAGSKANGNRQEPTAHLAPGEWRWLAGATLAGGVVAPVLLMAGLTAMPASSAALLLNAEGVFTALLAWFAFKENFDRRIALGMLAIVAGAVVLSWPGGGTIEFAKLWPALAVLGACFFWGLDNNLTRKVALADAAWLAMVKGLAAGSTNLVLAIVLGAQWPGLPTVAGAAVLGFLSYGASLALFVVALRHLGTARTGAYFSVAPFFGAVLALPLLGEPVTSSLLTGGALMAIGMLLHLTERHEHEHMHAPLEHDHAHTHGAAGADKEHHTHDHADGAAPPTGVAHSHPHRHLPLSHSHAHFPDAHHRHEH